MTYRVVCVLHQGKLRSAYRSSLHRTLPEAVAAFLGYQQEVWDTISLTPSGGVSGTPAAGAPAEAVKGCTKSV